jgi:hypothetical protein
VNFDVFEGSRARVSEDGTVNWNVTTILVRTPESRKTLVLGHSIKLYT